MRKRKGLVVVWNDCLAMWLGIDGRLWKGWGRFVNYGSRQIRYAIWLNRLGSRARRGEGRNWREKLTLAFVWTCAAHVFHPSRALVALPCLQNESFPACLWSPLPNLVFLWGVPFSSLDPTTTEPLSSLASNQSCAEKESNYIYVYIFSSFFFLGKYWEFFCNFWNIGTRIRGKIYHL